MWAPETVWTFGEENHFLQLSRLELRFRGRSAVGQSLYGVRCHTSYALNWRKSNQKMHWSWVYFLKIYLFICRTDVVRLFASRHQGACCMEQRKNNVYVFQDTLFP